MRRGLGKSTLAKMLSRREREDFYCSRLLVLVLVKSFGVSDAAMQQPGSLICYSMT